MSLTEDEALNKCDLLFVGSLRMIESRADKLATATEAAA